MDLLCICALVAVLIKHEFCQSSYLIWYFANAGLASVSIIFLNWWSRNELSACFSSKRSTAISYLIEIGYLVLSSVAWFLMADESSSGACHRDAPSITELMVDVIII